MLPRLTRRVGAFAVCALVAGCDADNSTPTALPFALGAADSARIDVAAARRDSSESLVSSLRGSAAVMLPADTFRLVLGAKSNNGRRSNFTTSNAAVVTVSATGLVQARGIGAAFVVALDGSQADTVNVRVEPGPALVIPSITTVTARVGETIPLSATVVSANQIPLYGHSVTFSSQNSAIASVSASGAFTAKANGQTQVIVTDGTHWTNIPVTVQPLSSVTSFSIGPSSSTLNSNETLQFSASATFSDGLQHETVVTYSAAGGTISANGLFTAGSTAGSYLVVARCQCGLVDTAEVVIKAAESIPAIPSAAPLVVSGMSATTASTAGGAEVELYGSGFGAGLKVVFGGTPGTVQVLSERLARVTIPPRSAAGLVSVTVSTEKSSSVFGQMFEYLPKPTKSHFSFDFENGSLAGTGASAWGGASAVVTAEKAAGGSRSVKLEVASGFEGTMARLQMRFLSPNPPVSDANGLYQRFSLYIPQSTYDNSWNSSTCYLYVSAPYCGQVKLLLNRYNGTQTETAPGWGMMGIGAQMVDVDPNMPLASRYAQTPMDWGIQRLNGCAPYLLPADRWMDVQVFLQRRNGIGYMKTWLNGQLVSSCNNAMLGTSSTSDALSMWLGVTYTQHVRGAVSVFVDNIKAADGFIDK